MLQHYRNIKCNYLFYLIVFWLQHGEKRDVYILIVSNVVSFEVRYTSKKENKSSILIMIFLLQSTKATKMLSRLESFKQDEQCNEEMKTLLIQLKHRNIEFNAAGLFPLNVKLITKVIFFTN